ncbi:RNA-binding protein 28-like [Heracleum sosnowskyi]|uniref:RNA-binding protein 28-like n=1 Tax=Heracleum sosnowskyi TaxID=360622 RepID=A0AAD8H198_9APIA|nr:RNA-binding protein 28-like [Heracleum sosnowskyi]
MGKNKKNKPLKQGTDSQYSPATVFIANLPFTFTNSQLEETFSDVGPIRRCFMVTKKGETEHRGVGFVQFATTEDVNRAIELKNGSSVGGRKIGVKHAMHRPPLQQRRSKGDQVAHEDGDLKSKNKKDDISSEVVNQEQDEAAAPQELEKKVRETDKPEEKKADKLEVEKVVKVAEKKVRKPGKSEIKDVTFTEKNVLKPDKSKAKKVAEGASDEKCYSEKQRLARTVIFGGLLSADMAESVHHKAKECGTVSSIIYPLSRDELNHHGLREDGCKMDASSVLFTSVRSARACVALLHQKEMSGGIVWARQLGGEGANTQKWKLIVRNLPYEKNETKEVLPKLKKKGNKEVLRYPKQRIEIKELFSKVGFVWEVIPQKEFQRFAFVKYTCKQDAENAIKKFNGTNFGGRPIAVDWAIPKKLYATKATQPLAASEEEQSGSDEEDDDMGTDMEEDENYSNEEVKSGIMEKERTEVDFDEEADVARKVLNTVIASSSGEAHVSPEDQSVVPKSNKDSGTMTVARKSIDGPTELAHDKKPGNTGKSESETQDLQKTLFICNLPFDVSTEEVKQRFKGFGEVQYFSPVLHHVTKRPKGTGFLKFKTIDAADAAISAASAVAGLGIILRGRQLKVMKALDKNSAHSKELEKTKKEDHDHRNLYLAKEGLIVEGTPAAQGVSVADMSKRQMLERTKAMKLRSPNFHISRTRLIIYNLPKSMTEKELKRRCIDAVTSRASKQKPVIRQIKFLKDEKKGKVVTKNHSRGVAFVEFTEHEHALVALRVLNNNPETFGPEHRPIVEFALDNIQTLKQRQEKIEFQQQQYQLQGSSQDGKNRQPRFDSHLPDARSNMSREHTSRGDFTSSKTSEPMRENKKEHEAVGVAAAEGKFNKRQKPSPMKWEKRTDSKFNYNEEVRRPIGKKHDNGGSPPVVSEVLTRNSRTIQEADDGRKKRKLQDRTVLNKDFSSHERKKSKKNKEPLGRDMEDKLDVLIKQYTSKFSGKAEGEKQGPPRQLKRWFQS